MTTKSPRKRPLRRRLRLRKPSLATLIWAVVSLALTIVFLLVQGMLLMLLMIVSLAVTALSALADAGADPAVGTGPPARKVEKPSARGNSAPARRAPAKKPGPARKRVCSARCQASTKPVATCNCVCGGKTHGKRTAPITTSQPKPVRSVGEVMRRVS